MLVADRLKVRGGLGAADHAVAGEEGVERGHAERIDSQARQRLVLVRRRPGSQDRRRPGLPGDRLFKPGGEHEGRFGVHHRQLEHRGGRRAVQRLGAG